MDAPHLKKSLGQHFLADPHIAQKMLANLNLTEEDLLLEIGPGAGALTRYLELLPHKKLILLEKDRYWIAERHKNARENTYALLQDAMTFDFRRTAPNWSIVGNLPYNIASALIWDIASKAYPVKQALFMVQKEVALRLCAKPSTKDYGALSVWVQTFLVPQYLFTVPPTVFSPRPKVDSAVVLFTSQSRIPTPQVLAHLQKLLRLFFQKRRKQIGSIAKQAGLKDFERICEDCGVHTRQRPEELRLESFLALAACLAQHETLPLVQFAGVEFCQ